MPLPAIAAAGPLLNVGKWAVIAVAVLGLLWFVRHDAAGDARKEVTAKVEAETAAEVLRQTQVSNAALEAAGRQAAEREAELEELRNALEDLDDSGSCPIPADVAERLLQIN